MVNFIKRLLNQRNEDLEQVNEKLRLLEDVKSTNDIVMSHDEYMLEKFKKELRA